MIGTIGFDFQATRAAACLLEWRGPDQALGSGTLRQGVIGDGRRLLIPVAAPGDCAGEDALWGSAAAEAALARLAAGSAGTVAPLAGLPQAWRGSPLTPEFLGGLRRRVLAYLGQPLDGPVRSHQLYGCADPGAADHGSSDAWTKAEQALAEAGLAGTELVRPADALLCRWLAANPDLSRTRTVLAIACGEAATDLALYAVQGTQEAVARLDRERVAAGADAWQADLVATVLGHCRPDTPARALLSLLDGADEFAAALRAQPAEVWAGDSRVEWSGPVSQHMFEPYRAGRAELAARPSVAGWTMPVAEAARRLADAAQGPVTILVGGPGAVWPFLADLLAVMLNPTSLDADGPDGGLWASGEPALDLAFGACWWPLFKRAFGRATTATTPVRPAGARLQVAAAPRRQLPGARPTDAPPPWENLSEPEGGRLPWEQAARPAGDPSPWVSAEPDDDPPPWETQPPQASAEPPPWDR